MLQRKVFAIKVQDITEWLHIVVRVGTKEYTPADETLEKKIKECEFIFASRDKELEYGFGMINAKYIIAYKDAV